MEWTAWQYRDVFDIAYSSGDEKLRAQIDARLDQLLERGNQSKRPISAPLGDGIHEFRVKDLRILFFFESEKRIVFVVSVVKKQSAVPRSAIDEAKRLRKLIVEKGQVLNAIN